MTFRGFLHTRRIGQAGRARLYPSAAGASEPRRGGRGGEFQKRQEGAGAGDLAQSGFGGVRRCLVTSGDALDGAGAGGEALGAEDEGERRGRRGVRGVQPGEAVLEGGVGRVLSVAEARQPPRTRSSRG